MPRRSKSQATNAAVPPQESQANAKLLTTEEEALHAKLLSKKNRTMLTEISGGTQSLESGPPPEGNQDSETSKNFSIMTSSNLLIYANSSWPSSEP